MHYAKHLAIWEVRRHEPGLRRLIEVKYPGESYEDVYFAVDLSSIPVNLSVRRTSSSQSTGNGPGLTELGEIPILFHVSYGPFSTTFEYVSKVGTTEFLDPRMPPPMPFTGPFQEERRMSGLAIQGKVKSVYDEIDDLMRWLNNCRAAKVAKGHGLHLAKLIDNMFKDLEEIELRSNRWPFETPLSHLCDVNLT